MSTEPTPSPPLADYAPMPPPTAPVADAQRIVTLDVLRGVAVLGILLVNIAFFASPFTDALEWEWDQLTGTDRVTRPVIQFVATGNATLGIVAASQLARDKGTVDIACRSAITVPATTTLFQGGVILKRTQNIDSAQSFMKFLSGEQAERLILKSGYKVPVN